MEIDSVNRILRCPVTKIWRSRKCCGHGNVCTLSNGGMMKSWIAEGEDVNVGTVSLVEAIYLRVFLSNCRSVFLFEKSSQVSNVYSKYEVPPAVPPTEIFCQRHYCEQKCLKSTILRGFWKFHLVESIYLREFLFNCRSFFLVWKI